MALGGLLHLFGSVVGWTLILLRSRATRRYRIWLLSAIALVHLLDAACTLAVGAMPGSWNWLDRSEVGERAASLIELSAFALLWAAYWAASKRVRNTFRVRGQLSRAAQHDE